jgi:hypothetical protein
VGSNLPLGAGVLQGKVGWRSWEIADSSKAPEGALDLGDELGELFEGEVVESLLSFLPVEKQVLEGRDLDAGLSGGHGKRVHPCPKKKQGKHIH